MSNSLVIANVTVSDIEFGKKQNCDKISELVINSILKLPKRILFSFSPPLNYNKQYLYTDVFGPVLSTCILISLLQYGFSCKIFRPHNITSVNIICTVVTYYVLISFFIFITSRSFVRIKLKILDVFTLIGYSFYGCILTLVVGLKILPDYVFYVSLIFFSGLSCIRVLLILIFIIDMPVVRLIICSIIGNIHILFVIYLYYFYIHPTYVFGAVRY